MGRKKIILSIFSLIIISLIIYGLNAEYTIYEITPDNYIEKLKSVNEPIYSAGLDNVIPDNFQLSFSKNYASSDNYQNNGIEISNKETENGNNVHLHSHKTNLAYNVLFSDGKMTFVWIMKWGLLDPDIPDNKLIRGIIDKLVLNESFILKRSKLKSGSDIIIKETDSYFIIGHFVTDAEYPQSISFSSYSKKKYYFKK
jgi:hypothetical protein